MGTGRFSSASTALWDDAGDDIAGARRGSDGGSGSGNAIADHDGSPWRVGRSRPAYPNARARALSVAAQVAATLGVFGLGYVAWDLGVSDVQAREAQHEVTQQIDAAWEAADVTGPEVNANEVAEGEPVAKLWIPKLGEEWNTTIVAGTEQADLMKGPGFYTGSQMFGTPGNAAVAGHRDGKGAPFHDLGVLGTCDVIAVETNTSWYLYSTLPVVGDPLADDAPRGYGAGEVDMVEAMTPCAPPRVRVRLASPEYSRLRGVSIHTPDDVDVVAPVPGVATIPPEQAGISMLTLTTCHPTWSNAERLIVHAALVEVHNKADHEAGWRPPALAAGQVHVDGDDGSNDDTASAEGADVADTEVREGV